MANGYSFASSGSSTGGTTYAGGAEDALAQLIQQLLSGGTPNDKANKAERNAEIATDRTTRAGYTKDAAFSDAQGAMSQQQRKALEQLLPSILRSAEGSGTSKNALRALLIQDAANKAAESSAALGLKASVDYGNINAGLSNTLEALTRPDNTTNQLIEALGVAKGNNSTSGGMASVQQQQQTGVSYATPGRSRNNIDLGVFTPNVVNESLIGVAPQLDIADSTAALGQQYAQDRLTNGVSSIWDNYTF